MSAQELSSIISRCLKEEHQDIYYFMVAMFEYGNTHVMYSFQEIQNKILEAKILYLVMLFIINDPEQKMYLTFAYNASGETICYYSFDQIIFYGLIINYNRMDASEAITIRRELVNFKGGSIFDMFGKEYV